MHKYLSHSSSSEDGGLSGRAHTIIGDRPWCGFGGCPHHLVQESNGAISEKKKYWMSLLQNLWSLHGIWMLQ